MRDGSNVMALRAVQQMASDVEMAAGSHAGDGN